MPDFRINKDHLLFTTISVDSICVVYGRAGSGKSLLLSEFALSYLCRSKKVLHFSNGDQRKLRAQYSRAQDVIPIQHRLLHTRHGDPFSALEIQKLCQQYSDLLDFHPDLIIVEDVDIDGSWELLAHPNRSILISTSDRSISPSFSNIELVEIGQKIEIHSSLSIPSVYINPQDQFIYEAISTKREPNRTLYATGAAGAETVFGEQAEKWSIQEKHYQFAGHIQNRMIGSVLLNEEELNKGTVSLHYVSRKLRRSWNKTPLLKRVLQLIWHMVYESDQIFVVGSIQEDNTVHGGTGWSVELAQRWKKPIWVFDQDKEHWFSWKENQWCPCQTPKITAIHFAGSGTRFLRPVGKKAIEDLFTHSFS